MDRRVWSIGFAALAVCIAFAAVFYNAHGTECVGLVAPVKPTPIPVIEPSPPPGLVPAPGAYVTPTPRPVSDERWADYAIALAQVRDCHTAETTLLLEMLATLLAAVALGFWIVAAPRRS